MSDALRIVYTPHPNTTVESEAVALSTVYEFILRCAEVRKAKENPAAGPSGRGVNDGTETKEDSAYGRIIP